MPSERRDVVRNRVAILAAAERLFAARGASVPLAEIAAAAGVGRATLTRHFPERYLLASAVYHRHLDRVEAYAAGHATDAAGLGELVRRIVHGQRTLAGLFPMLRAIPQAADHLAALGRRLDAIFTSSLVAAQERGEVDPRITIDDLHLVLTMAEGLLASYDGAELDWGLDRALTIMLAALRPGVVDQEPRRRPGWSSGARGES